MTDAPTQPPAPPAPATPEPAKPPKRPGIFRTGFILVVLLLVVAGIASFPFVIEPWIVAKVRTAITDAGMDLSPETTIDVSVFGAKLTATNLRLTETYEGETRTVFTADELTADVAVVDCLGGDVVIDHLVATGATGDLRRRKDGTIPVITPKDGGDGIDWGTIDWYEYYKKAVQKWKERKEEERRQQEEEAKKPPGERTPPTQEPALDWPEAVQYEPAPQPGERGPRVLIRDLRISGKGLGLPDDTPFDIVAFTIEGKDLTGIQLPGEVMTLKGNLTTEAAGEIALDLLRNAGDTGTFALAAKRLPLTAINHAKVSGGALSEYGATGIADLTLNSQWSGWDLTGLLDSTLTDFDLNPTGGGSEAMQAAQLVKQLKGKPIRWPMKIGGTLISPRITDSGVDELVKGGVGDAVKGAVKDRASEEAGKLLDKEGAKNPELKKKADDLFKGLGR
jgi:hypothetical protein